METKTTQQQVINKDSIIIKYSCGHSGPLGAKCMQCLGIKPTIDEKEKLYSGFSKTEQQCLLLCDKLKVHTKVLKVELIQVNSQIGIRIIDLMKSFNFEFAHDNENVQYLYDGYNKYNESVFSTLNIKGKSIYKFLMSDEYNVKYWDPIKMSLKFSINDWFIRKSNNIKKALATVVGVVSVIASAFIMNRSM